MTRRARHADVSLAVTAAMRSRRSTTNATRIKRRTDTRTRDRDGQAVTRANHRVAERQDIDRVLANQQPGCRAGRLGGVTLRGHDQLRPYVEALRTAFPDCVFSLVVSGRWIGTGYPPALLSTLTKDLQVRLFCVLARKTSGRCGRSFRLRGLPGTSGPCGDSRRSLVRDVRMRRSRRSSALVQATKDAYLQEVYGSDGTRTRDLRRDRPVLALPG
jgi:hypothetical protein